MRPSNLVYGLEDRPSPAVGTLLGLQHVSIISIAFVLPVLLVRETGGGAMDAVFMVSMSMLAGAVGVVVQGLRRGPAGSGFLCPAVCGPSFLSASMLAGRVGGLPLLFGMTMFAGLLEAFLSRFLHKLRFLFPAEVTGVIVSMVGITVIKLAGKSFLGWSEGGFVHLPSLLVALFTLAVMVGLNVWSRGQLKLFCVLVGMAAGYGAAYGGGLLTGEDIRLAWSQPLVWNPFAHHPGWSFDPAMCGPFAVAVLCSMLKSVGDLTTCQKINDSDWVRPDMQNIRKGVLADAVGCFSAGLFGGMAQSTSSSNIGLSIATGATSRILSLFIGAVLTVLAFCPKLASIFAVMPEPVVGATLLFALSFMVVAGIQIISSRMIDARKTFVIGLSLITGLMVDVLPGAFESLPAVLAPVFSSSLSACTVTAVVLNLVFRIGIKSKAVLVLEPGRDVGREVATFMDRQGGAWGARPDVVRRAATAAMEYLEALQGLRGPGPATLEAAFEEMSLDLSLRHQGEPLAMPDDRPSPEAVLESEHGAWSMGLWMCARLADRVSVSRARDGAQVRMHWDH